MSEFLTLALSLLMPMIVSWLKRESWPEWAKVTLALALSILGGAVTAAVEGSIDLATVTTSSAIIFTSATVFFKAWFQHTTLNAQLEQSGPFAESSVASMPPNTSSHS